MVTVKNEKFCLAKMSSQIFIIFIIILTFFRFIKFLYLGSLCKIYRKIFVKKVFESY